MTAQQGQRCSLGADKLQFPSKHWNAFQPNTVEDL